MSPRQRGERLLAGAARRLLGDRRLLIATNRGPVTFSIGADGGLRPRRGSGGLVTALSQVGQHVPLTWLAAPFSDGDRLGINKPSLIDQALPGEVRLRFTPVERPMYEAAYGVIANPLLWFLQHQMWELPDPADDRHRHAARLGQRLRPGQRGLRAGRAGRGRRRP